MYSVYDDTAAVQEAIRQGRHRDLVGGLWDEIGRLQFDFLRLEGMQPHHSLLDIGAGALRLGRLAVSYLDAGNYYATDLNADLLYVGRGVELRPQDQARFPASNIFVDDEFDFSFLPAPMDFGIAQSVFTHLPLNHLRRCLIRAEPHFKTGGKLFVTAFICPPGTALDRPFADQDTGIVTSDIRDPFHHRFGDFAFAAEGLGWRARVVGDWGHPRNQQVVEYLRS